MSTMQTTMPVTWEDVERMPEDGNRYEWMAGRLYVTPAPRLRHQRVSKRLQTALLQILEQPGHGEVFYAPVLVEFPGSSDRVQPDLLFVSAERRRILGEKAVLDAPDLVVEILSPTTSHRDRGVKLDIYARHGVREYWIVDPVRDIVDVWRFGRDPEGRRERVRHAASLPVHLNDEQVGVIDLAEVFSRHLDAWAE